MRRRTDCFLHALLAATLWGTAAVSLAAASQDRAPEIPPREDVASIRIPGGKSGGLNLPRLTVTDEKEVAAVLKWLRDVDWSRKPKDTRTMFLPRLLDLEVLKRDKSAQKFRLTAGGVIVGQRYWEADTKSLEKIVRGFKGP